MLKQFLEWRESGSKTSAELIAFCRERIASRAVAAYGDDARLLATAEAIYKAIH